MQKFIVKITSENISLIDDSRVECFLLDSAADTAFNRRFAEAARKAGKLLLPAETKRLNCAGNWDWTALWSI